MSCLSCIHCLPATVPAGSLAGSKCPVSSPAIPSPPSHVRCVLNGFTVNARMTCEEYAPRTENPE